MVGIQRHRVKRAAALCIMGVFLPLAVACGRKKIDGNARPQVSATPAPVASDPAPPRPPASSDRQAAIATIAPAPLPTSLPLLGPPGMGADGYPTQYVDRPALRSLLWHRRYPDLTRYMEQFQSEFEANAKREYWPHDAAAAFHSAEPELLASLDAWVKATPDSFAPYLARGSYWLAAAYARRGAKLAADTPAADMAGMEDALKHALPDLARALAIRPKLVAARSLEIEAHMLDSPAAQTKAAFDQAIAACPTCYVVRTVYMIALEPRWGGSYDQMTAFARASASIANPRMRLLPGYIDRDKADVLSRDEKWDDALAAIDRACALGDGWSFFMERARIRRHRNELDLALADLDRAAAARPGEPRVLFERAFVSLLSKRLEPAARDMLAGLRVDATDATARWMFDNVVQGVIFEGWEHYKAGRRDDALRVYDLAKELAPTNRELSQRRDIVILGVPYGSDAGVDIAALEGAVKERPDDFRAVQQLDYALAREGKFDRIIAAWTDYLSRHPNDGQVHLERGGSYRHAGKNTEAIADFSSACELGVSEGCARAKQLGSNASPR